jgi:hypothetical protein
MRGGIEERCEHIVITKTDGNSSTDSAVDGSVVHIKIDLEETGCKIMTQSYLIVETIQWHELVNKVMILA